MIGEKPKLFPAAPETSNWFTEMEPFMVEVTSVDDSRDAIYTRLDGE